MSKVVLSVLIPVFNGDEYIGRCLRSVLRQETELNYEIILVDDGSTDLTSYAIAQFGKDVRTIRHNENRGLPAALNTGLSIVEGKYLVRVDVDDYVNKWFIQFLYEYLTRNDEFDAVACDYLIVDEQENILTRESAETSPIACGILFKTQNLRDLGGYNEEFRLLEDKEFRVRFDSRFQVGFLRIPLYRYRKHSSNITNDKIQISKYEKILDSKATELGKES